MKQKPIVILILIIFLWSSVSYSAGLHIADKKESNTFSTTTQTQGTETNHISIPLHFSVPTIVTSDFYTNVSIQEASSFLMEPGKPILPTQTFTLSFPLGTKIMGVNCTWETSDTLMLSQKVEPAPYPIALDGNQSYYPKIDLQTYNSLQSYPRQYISYRVGGGLDQDRHVTFLNIQVYPIKYYPVMDILEYSTQGNIIITYEEPVQIPFPVNDDYDLLILAPSEFKSKLQPLVDHKNSSGVKTKLVTLEEIPANGRDAAENVKYFIKSSIEEWGVRYVLLVGEADKFPVRYTNIYVVDNNEIRDDELFASDLYFADIYDADGNFSSWDSNNNDRFGEYNYMNEGLTDSIDLYPDVYVGRLACVDETEVEIVVNKTIYYENITAYGQPWFTDIVLCGGDSFPEENEDSINEGEHSNQIVLDLLEGFNGTKLWASNNKIRSASNINKAIEGGAGFVYFAGHGSPTSWVTHPHNQEKWLPTGGYTTRTVDGLSNGEKLPIVIIDACSCSKFTEREDCLGWQFVRHQDGGAVATIAAAGLGWAYVGKSNVEGLIGQMAIKTFKSYADGALTFGEMWNGALVEYLSIHGKSMSATDYKTVEEWIPFGDPSLAIGTPSISPEKPTLNGPNSGKKGEEYTYSSFSFDPDEDVLYYLFEWGDGTNTGWLGPYDSGVMINVSHIWSNQGDYQIRVKAKDEHGAQSVWSDPLPISVPKSKAIDIKALLVQLLENHPYIFPFVRLLLHI